jgi:prepilin-type N-terminal cleavage/methylation domain-containing protein
MTRLDLHRPRQTARRRSNGERGFSMTELTIVISILGVLATITITSFNHLLSGSKDAVASERLEMLNRALHTFCQQNKEIVYTRNDSAGNDETYILRTLQFRNPDPDRAQTGSPFFDPRYNPIVSSATSDHRIRWTGRCYELLKPGTAGSGIKMNFDGTDFTTPFVFPPNFQMAGR